MQIWMLCVYCVLFIFNGVPPKKPLNKITQGFKPLMGLSQGLGLIYKDILAFLKKKTHTHWCLFWNWLWATCLFIYIVNTIIENRTSYWNSQNTEISKCGLFICTPFSVVLLDVPSGHPRGRSIISVHGTFLQFDPQTFILSKLWHISKNSITLLIWQNTCPRKENNRGPKQNCRGRYSTFCGLKNTIYVYIW